MKRALLIIVLLLGIKGLFAQALYLPGKIVKGKGVKYEVFACDDEPYTVEVRNVKNKDTVHVNNRQQNLFPDNSYEKVFDILCRNLTKEEKAEIVETGSNLAFIFRLDKQGKVREVVFIILECKESYSGFWQSFPPERFHQIEREIVKEVRMDEIHRDEYEYYSRFDINFVCFSFRFRSDEKQKH